LLPTVHLMRLGLARFTRAFRIRPVRSYGALSALGSVYDEVSIQTQSM
jgi:hypothetical protein